MVQNNLLSIEATLDQPRLPKQSILTLLPILKSQKPQCSSLLED